MANRRQGRSQGKRGKGPRPITAPLTPRGARKEIRASTNQRFKPLEKAITGELRASNRRVKEVEGWWDNYLATVNAGQADTAAAYAQAAQTNQAQIGQASAIDTANTQRLQAEAAKSAELRGAAPTTAPAEREAAMQAQRNYLATAQGGATAQMGANQRGYLNEQKRIGAGQSIASRKEEQRRGLSIRKDLRTTRDERGNYAVTKRGELRDKERDYKIQTAVAQLNRGKFGLERRQAGNEELEGAFGRRSKEHELSQRDKELRQEGRRIREGGKGGGGGPTRSERHDARAEKQNAWAGAKSLYEKRRWSSWTALETHLRKETEVTPYAARWAIQKLKRQAKREEREAAVDPNGASIGR